MMIRLLHCVRSGELLMDTMKSINSMISANDAAKETAIENDIVEILNSIIASSAPGITHVNQNLFNFFSQMIMAKP